MLVVACSKSTAPSPPAPVPAGPFNVVSRSIDYVQVIDPTYDVSTAAKIRFKFNAPVDRGLSASSSSLIAQSGTSVPYNLKFENGDSTIVLEPVSLNYISNYTAGVSRSLKSSAGITLTDGVTVNLTTKIDSSRKFPFLSDQDLLTKVQQQTFKYFWDFAHPASGLARERSNGDNNTVTAGGSGFGVMAIIVGIERDFISRAEGLTRMQKIVEFLKNTTQTFHGAFSHWIHGSTGVAIPFSVNDNGADLVETAFLVQGLLTARQYFNGTDPIETGLRNDINAIWNAVEWDWFRRNGEQVLYWHWSPDKQWQMNVQVKGWNECLITYVLAASSVTHSIPKSVYENGWASNGGMKNNSNYYGYNLPLGPAGGGPLFFAHYSFLGINPNTLSDQYANYTTQTKNHTLINYNYCKTNPGKYFGYSDSVWGLTASDVENGYRASSPTDDAGFIAPTAALSSFPYTPVESMQALKFYYYVLGDKIWKDFGFVDAFSLSRAWFAESFLAIDQGPIIVMIENYRTGLLWNLFTSCPEIKAGMRSLGFSASYL